MKLLFVAQSVALGHSPSLDDRHSVGKTLVKLTPLISNEQVTSPVHKPLLPHCKEDNFLGLFAPEVYSHPFNSLEPERVLAERINV